MHHGVHFLGGQVEVGLPVVGDEEAMTVAVPLHHALDFTQQRCLRTGIVAGTTCVLKIFDDRISAFLKRPGTLFKRIIRLNGWLGNLAQVAELVDALVSGTSG